MTVSEGELQESLEPIKTNGAQFETLIKEMADEDGVIPNQSVRGSVTTFKEVATYYNGFVWKQGKQYGDLEQAPFGPFLEGFLSMQAKREKGEEPGNLFVPTVLHESFREAVTAEVFGDSGVLTAVEDRHVIILDDD